MKFTLYWLSFIFLIVFCSGFFNWTAAQTQSSTSASSDVKRGAIEHQVQLQLLVASNTDATKTDYPSNLEIVVKQLKSSQPFKNHRLIATYLYNVADDGNLEVSDVTYAAFEFTGGLPTFFSFGISGIKLDNKLIHISEFRFEERKKIFTDINNQSSNADKREFNVTATGIKTELNVKEGIPTMVGKTTSGLSNGVLIIIITVNHCEM